MCFRPEQPQNYSWIGPRCQLGRALAFGLSMSDFNSESRFGILMKNYTGLIHWIFGITRIEFPDFCVSALWCNWKFFSFSTFCINHGSVAVVSRRVGPRWWLMRAFWKAQNHPLRTRPSRACREVVNMLFEAVDRDSTHGGGE